MKREGRQYDPVFRKEVVEEYIEARESKVPGAMARVCREYGVAAQNIDYWIKHPNSKSSAPKLVDATVASDPIQPKTSIASETFKGMVAKAPKANGKGKKPTAKLFGAIPDIDTTKLRVMEEALPEPTERTLMLAAIGELYLENRKLREAVDI